MRLGDVMEKKQLNILLIEDNSADAHLIQEYFLDMPSQSANLFPAATLSDGLKYLNGDHVFDVILMDLSLPDSIGFDTYAAVYARANTKPIIVLTGLDDETLARQTVRQGAQDYLVKDVLDAQLLSRSIQYAIERKHIEVSLEAEKVKAEQASVAKSLFLANMSHEFRTPLNAILGYCEMIKEEVDSLQMPDLSKDLQKIHASGSHLLYLIDEILDLSKLEAGEMNISQQPVCVSSLVREIAHVLSDQICQKGNVLIVDAEKNFPVLYSDEARLRQCLLNVLDNANKFTNCGEIVFKAFFEDQHRPTVVFQVRDTGVGIPAEKMETIFRAFSQADESSTRKHDGTGLGLTITKLLTELLGGTIHLDSNINSGTCVTMQFPLSPDQDE